MGKFLNGLFACKIKLLALRALRPMRVRTAVMLITFMVAIQRLFPGLGLINTVVYPLNYFPQWFFGWMCLFSALLLFATRKRLRLKIAGRLSATLALSTWAALLVSTTSWTSRGIDLVIITILLVEILTPYDDC